MSAARIMLDVITTVQIVTVHLNVPVIKDIHYKAIRKPVSVGK